MYMYLYIRDTAPPPYYPQQLPPQPPPQRQVRNGVLEFL